jgi:hypothetical protein
MTDTTDTTDDTERGSNYNAHQRVKEAKDLANTAHARYREHVADNHKALAKCLGLLEDWKGDHREKLTAYFRVPDYPQKKDDGDDDVAAALVVVKCVFADCDRQMWQHHANALRQAMAEGKTAENVLDYFDKEVSENAAAGKWSATRRKMKADAQQGDEAQTLNHDLFRLLLGIDRDGKRALRYVGMMLEKRIVGGEAAETS